jgi:hypothetical protein
MAQKKGIFERITGEIVGKAEDYVVEKVKRRIIRIGEISIFLLLSFVMISFGLATLAGTYIPVLANGLNFMLLGVIYLFIAMLLKY